MIAIPTKIISGGQTGVDRGGLDAAIALGIDRGGWAPKGWRADDGVIPERYRVGMVESSSSSYGPRTQLNVRDGHGTLLLSLSGCLTGGSDYTRRRCQVQGRPWLHIALPGDAVALAAWLARYRVLVLNVAGPRERKEPGVQQAVCSFLVSALGPPSGV